MSMGPVATIILAAGLGKRMRSKQAKVLHTLAGRPMLLYSVEAAERIPSKRIIVVVGHQAEQVKQALRKRPVEIVHQTRLLGTGHAVLQCRQALADYKGPVLILNADVPLVSVETIGSMIQAHRDQDSVVTVLTATLPDPTGYGRVLRNSAGEITDIVEESDASPQQRSVREINTGFYIVDAHFLFEALKGLKNHNAQEEYYLPDIIKVAIQKGSKVADSEASDPEEVMGINSRLDLARMEKAVYRRMAERHMRDGVTLLDPDSIRIDPGVTIGRDTVISPNVYLEGATQIGEDCRIHSGSRVSECRIAKEVTVRDFCVLTESVLEEGVTVGPFAHLRPGTRLHRGAKVGNFVETKKAELGEGSKANHLSYLGDATIGKDVNIGAGTITCNYDGVHKHRTVIEDGVFVGSDTQFVAPVKIGARSIIGAGSTITSDVPPDSLALSRTAQVHKGGWARKRNRPMESKTSSPQRRRKK